MTANDNDEREIPDRFVYGYGGTTDGYYLLHTARPVFWCRFGDEDLLPSDAVLDSLTFSFDPVLFYGFVFVDTGFDEARFRQIMSDAAGEAIEMILDDREGE